MVALMCIPNVTYTIARIHVPEHAIASLNSKKQTVINPSLIK
jgi:hypothetical protein